MNGLLKFITCGSVDDGKSTLIGHILYDSKLIYADQEKALELDSKVGSRGGKIDYSLLLDGLMAEREQGITIDVAYRYFTTNNRSFIVADTPGHEEYTRNMAVGASFAQLAVILVDAKQGVLVQTKRHSRICKLMGIDHFVYAVNKMDLVDYDETRFKEIEKDITALAQSLGLKNVKIIPVSATEGDNLTSKSEKLDWYKGSTLLEYLENVDVSDGETNGNFYMPVQRVCRPNHSFRGFQGQIESGSIAIGESLVTLPSNETATVKSILVGDKSVSNASAGQAVTIQLNKEVDISRGCVLSSNAKIPVSKRISTSILWMDDNSLEIGKEYHLKLGTKIIPAIVRGIQYKTDVNTGEHIPASTITKNELARCEIEFSEKIVVDRFDTNRTLGEFILIDRVTHMTSACGIVESVEESEEKPYFVNGDIKAGGCIFEEFYFNLESSLLTQQKTSDKQYTKGSEVPVEGDSFTYPDFFDIIAADDNAAILVRDRKIEDIVPLADYKYSGLPVLDAKGFSLKINSNADFDNFIYAYRSTEPEKRSEIYNKWARFETYRRVVCTDSFWII